MNWSYVGSGQGDFELNEKYGFVGNGGGSWRRDVTTTYQGWKMKPACKLTMVLVVCAGLGVALGELIRSAPGAGDSVMGWRDNLRAALHVPGAAPAQAQAPRSFSPAPVSSTTTSTTTSSIQAFTTLVAALLAPPAPLAPQIDCQAGADDWQDLWSLAKMVYCCDSVRLGCSYTGEQDDSAGFDCDVVLPQLWAPEKSTYCCETQGRGCPTASTTLISLGEIMDQNCDISQHDSWDVVKRARCCQTQQVGCPTGEGEPTTSKTSSSSTSTAASTTTAAPETTTTSSTKTTTIAAPEPTRTAAPEFTEHYGSYDCKLDLRAWVTAWDPTKKAWCCQKEHVACPPVPDASMMMGVDG